MGEGAKNWTQGLTPFRYPGGKAFLASEIEARLAVCSPNRPTRYAEAYAGGAGAAIQLLASNAVERIYLNDFDWRIYAVWFSILNHTDEFIDRLMSVRLDVETWREQKQVVQEADIFSSSTFEVGFGAFYLNRTNRSGIIIGAGPIGGYEQAGKWKIDARFSREALASRIRWISAHADRIELSNEDGLAFLRRTAPSIGEDTFYFIDPPYVTAGSRLYMNAMSEIIHLNLAKFLITNDCMPHWLVTYDDHPLIRSAYEKANVKELSVRYTLQRKRAAGELFITPQV